MKNKNEAQHCIYEKGAKVLNSSLVHLMKFCAENPRHYAKSSPVSGQLKKNTQYDNSI